MKMKHAAALLFVGAVLFTAAAAPSGAHYRPCYSVFTADQPQECMLTLL